MCISFEGGKGKRQFGVVGGNILSQHAYLEFPKEVERGEFAREGRVITGEIKRCGDGLGVNGAPKGSGVSDGEGSGGIAVCSYWWVAVPQVDKAVGAVRKVIAAVQVS